MPGCKAQPTAWRAAHLWLPLLLRVLLHQVGMKARDLLRQPLLLQQLRLQLRNELVGCRQLLLGRLAHLLRCLALLLGLLHRERCT